MEMHISGVNIHYELAGSGAKRVVLLHGWGCSTELMKPVADALSADMTVLSVDFPAHGKSTQPPEPWGVPEFAACLKELLIKLNFLPCSVIAHSFGGRVTIELASADEKLFDRIILTGAAGIRKQADGKASKKTTTYKKLKSLVELSRKLHIFGDLPDKWQEALIQKYGSKDYASLSPEMRKTFVKVVNYDQSDKLAKIKNSTLLVWGDKDTETPLWMNGEETVLYGEGFITDILCGCSFRISAKSFYQINPTQTEKLYGLALENAGLTGKETVLDAYCGVGTMSLLAAGRAKRVIGVEINESAVENAAQNAALNGIRNAEFHAADAGEYMNNLLRQRTKVDVVLVDPPRAGCSEKFLKSLIRLSPEKIVYVSCNPDTLGRDAITLRKGGYRVERVTPVDMFPFTTHVESVVRLTRIQRSPQ